MTIKIGFEEFKTQAAAKDRVRAVLARLPLQRPIFGQHDFLEALLTRHPAAKDKIGPGIAGWEIRLNVSGHREVYVHRTDGTVVDFSWHRCIIGKPANSLKDLKGAMRDAVRGQVEGFRDSLFVKNVACALCRKPMESIKCIHVDHIKPFDSLVSAFLLKHPTRPETFGTCKTNGPAFLSKDAAFADAWRAYHSDNAHLRLVCVRCNLTRKKKATPQPKVSQFALNSGAASAPPSPPTSSSSTLTAPAEGGK